MTDSTGRPIANKTVNWQFTATQGIQISFIEPSTTTDANGIAYAHFTQGSQIGTASIPYLQTAVLATVDSVSATFYLTNALVDNTGTQFIYASLIAPVDGDIGKSIGTGPAGSQAPVPIQVHVDAFGQPVANVNVRLQNSDPTTQPSATCITQAGADPGSVLTDANGNATCNAIFGPISSKTTGALNILVGGLDPANFDYTVTNQPLTQALAYQEYDGIRFTVTPVTAGQVRVSSGNNQVINPGQSSSPLVVQVTDSTGAVSVSGAGVTWSLSPTTGASLSTTSSTTNSSGLAQTTIVLSAAASGQYTVKAALTGTPSLFTTFLVSTNVQVGSLAKVSGDSQTSPANQVFGSPLIVQVNGNNGQPLSGTSVGFSISGPGTLSANSAVTDGNGRAQVSVTAGGTAGAVTVVASVGNISQVFSLTVIPPGPSLTSSSFVNAAGLGTAMSPCSLVTASAAGLAPGLKGLVLPSNAFGPYPTTLAGDSVTVNNVAAPLASVGTVNGVEQLTFQVPCETAAGNATVAINVSGGSASANINLITAAPGVFETVMSDNVKRAVAVRPDGTYVSLANPARRGEVIRVLVDGLGATTPSVGTAALPVPGSDALVSGQVIVGVNNAGARLITARLSPNLIGVYEVAFQVPSDAPTGNDIVLSVAINPVGGGATSYSNGSKLPIQ